MAKLPGQPPTSVGGWLLLVIMALLAVAIWKMALTIQPVP